MISLYDWQHVSHVGNKAQAGPSIALHDAWQAHSRQDMSGTGLSTTYQTHFLVSSTV